MVCDVDKCAPVRYNVSTFLKGGTHYEGICERKLQLLQENRSSLYLCVYTQLYGHCPVGSVHCCSRIWQNA